MPKFTRNPLLVFVSLVIIVIFVMFLNLVGVLRPIKNLALTIFSPIERGTSSIGSKIGGFFNFFTQIKNLAKKNKQLENQVQSLMVDNEKFKEIQRENELLREQLDYEQYAEHKIKPAFIFGFDPNNLLQTININRGEKDGIKNGMGVVAGKGILVGQIQETTYSTSSALLITDGHSVIPAKIIDAGADGVIKGEHGLGLVMEMIPQDKFIKTGDIVVTSDLGAKVSKDLVIGEIEEILSTENELFQRARIKSPVDFKELESVYVVLE